MQIFAGILTISDRASRGEYEDLSGPALREAARGYGWQVVGELIVPDDVPKIRRAVKELASEGCHVILSSGGTGVSPRDVTPEAVRGLARAELPGFGEAMRAGSMRLTPNAILSRGLAAVVEKALVICLPGKPSGAVECLGFVAPAVPHCVEVLQESDPGC